MSERAYRICNRCIMDTSDPEVVFDADGNCNHCVTAIAQKNTTWFPNEEGRLRLEKIVGDIKAEGQGKDYDCIMGLSGGADSSYMALKIKAMGLRPLVVHVDGGWNSELAVNNIEILVKELGYDLYTCVVDWEEMRDLQLAYFRSALANQDVPQDHVYFAALYHWAVKHNIRYVLSGGNFASESILPKAWGYYPMDRRQLKAVHRRFGRLKLRTYPSIGFFRTYFYYPYVKKMEVIRPLNYMHYDRTEAIAILERELGWRNYGGKHHESQFTKFFQAHFLPHRFGIDKRRAHLSSLVVSGQVTREAAIEEMLTAIYSCEAELREDTEYMIKKLGISETEFDEIMNLPIRTFRDYPSNYRLFVLKDKLKKLLRLRPRFS